MAFRVRIDPVALRHIEEFAAYLRGYSEEFATEQIEIDRITGFRIRQIRIAVLTCEREGVITLMLQTALVQALQTV